MTKLTNIRKGVDLDAGEWVNNRTGESLTDLNYDIKITQDTHLMTIHSDEYVVVDSDAYEYLEGFLKPVELAYILKMSNMLKTEMNALFTGNNHPHTLDTLSREVKLVYDRTLRLVNKLVKVGVLYKFSGYRSNQPFKAYLMNPFLARKRKTVDKELGKLFDPLALRNKKNCGIIDTKEITSEFA